MKRLIAMAMALLFLASCGPSADGNDPERHILCATYPIYLLTTALVGDAPDTEVELLVDQQVSCLHDYTLTVADMRAIDRADAIVMNGAGLEDFLGDALVQSDAAVIDCSSEIELLESQEDHAHDHDHDEELDPHYWMDHRRAKQMTNTISAGLSNLYPAQAQVYDSNAKNALAALERMDAYGESGASPLPLITFHDGFQYFADAYGFQLIKSIEEEEGAEASAHELREIIALVKQYQIPAIFVEKNGSRRSADVIARETGCKVYELDMLMSGDGYGIDAYVQAMDQNIQVVRGAFG